MMTRERELLQQALNALDRAISDDRAYIRECKDAAEAIRAHLAAQPAPVPPSYKLALVEPTDDMVQAAAEAWDAAPGLYAAFAAALRAGIAASPEQPK